MRLFRGTHRERETPERNNITSENNKKSERKKENQMEQTLDGKIYCSFEGPFL